VFNAVGIWVEEHTNGEVELEGPCKSLVGREIGGTYTNLLSSFIDVCVKTDSFVGRDSSGEGRSTGRRCQKEAGNCKSEPGSKQLHECTVTRVRGISGLGMMLT